MPSTATVTQRPRARRTAALAPARSICAISQPPKMSPDGFGICRHSDRADQWFAFRLLNQIRHKCFALLIVQIFTAKLLVSEERRRQRVGQWQNRCLAIAEAPVLNYWLHKARKLGVE